MQYGETYIGRRFRLVRPHYEGAETFAAGWIGILKSVNIKAGLMLLEFKGVEFAGTSTARAWIKEANVVLDSAPAGEFKATAPSGDPKAPDAKTQPKAEPKIKRLREYQPQMMAVKSTNVKAIGHFEEGMVVEFTNGTAYIYSGVDFDAYNDVLMADSVGKAYNAKIKSNADYTSTKLEA